MAQENVQFTEEDPISSGTDSDFKFEIGSLVKYENSSRIWKVMDRWLESPVGDPTKIFYDLTDDTGDGSDAEEKNLRLHLSAEDASKRRLPTAEEFVKGFDWLADSWDGSFDITEANPDGDQVLLYGETKDGLNMSVAIKVTNIERG